MIILINFFSFLLLYCPLSLYIIQFDLNFSNMLILKIFIFTVESEKIIFFDTFRLLGPNRKGTVKCINISDKACRIIRPDIQHPAKKTRSGPTLMWIHLSEIHFEYCCFDFYEHQQRKLKKNKCWCFSADVDRYPQIIPVKVRENRYSCRDFVIIILDASELSHLFIFFLYIVHSTNGQYRSRVKNISHTNLYLNFSYSIVKSSKMMVFLTKNFEIFFKLIKIIL